MKFFLMIFLFSTLAMSQEVAPSPSALQGIPDPNQPIYVETNEMQAALPEKTKKSSFQNTLEVIKKLEVRPRALASEK